MGRRQPDMYVAEFESNQRIRVTLPICEKIQQIAERIHQSFDEITPGISNTR